MRLRKFYVKSYRSIVEATLDDIQPYCVIVGPNNAGKSNLLRAIYVSLSIALEGDFQRVRRRSQYSYAYSGEDYNWNRDIPASLKDDEKASTVFKLTFDFSEEEKIEFKEKFGINLSKSLQMKFQLFVRTTEYNIIMPGRAKRPMEEKIQEIGMFIRSKLDFEYIPCVRSTEFTAEYFSRLLIKELSQLEENPEYQQCIHTIQQLQAPILNDLEQKLVVSLKAFIPNVTNVKLDRNVSSFGFTARRSTRMHRIPIEIDDGTLTSLDDKGDGIKSLAAIGIVQNTSFENAYGKALVLCIEEPEAHLHPDAVHSLRSIISEIAARKNVQVIISTHSPILIDRDKVSNNVIVSDHHVVSSCASITQIRELLGVRVADNLSSRKIVLVEGESDLRYFKSLCFSISPVLSAQIEKGDFEFVNVHSASKMDYQVRLYNSLMVSTVVLLDSDKSGLEAQKNLLDTKTKLPNEILMIKSIGMNECELEDIVAFDAYTEEVLNKYNIALNTKQFKSRKKPWSDRLHEAASKSPGVFNDHIEKQIKTTLADIVEEKGLEAIAEYDRDYVKALIQRIEHFATT